MENIDDIFKIEVFEDTDSEGIYPDNLQIVFTSDKITFWVNRDLPENIYYQQSDIFGNKSSIRELSMSDFNDYELIKYNVQGEGEDESFELKINFKFENKDSILFDLSDNNLSQSDNESEMFIEFFALFLVVLDAYIINNGYDVLYSGMDKLEDLV